MMIKLLFKDIPDTQRGRNIYFEQKYQDAEQALRIAIETAEREFEGQRLEQFRKLQSAWEVYRNMDADFVSSEYASEYEGARMWPQVRAHRLEELTRIRIVEIEQLVGELFETKLKRIVESKG
ncbi:MAG: lysozyme inhibitor LprI family protein [Candidatus Binatia bacterium]